MRIGIQTWGSEGDIRPFVALASGLVEAGHDVTLVATDIAVRDYERYQDTLGMKVRMVATPVLEVDEMERLGEEMIGKWTVFEQGRLIFQSMFEPVVPQLLEAAQSLCAQSDLVIGHHILHPLQAAAEASGTPWISITLATDVIPSRQSSPPGLPSLHPAWNRFWWRFGMKLVDSAILGGVNELRSGMGLDPRREMKDVWHSELLDLVALSPTLCPRPPDWDDRHKMCGFLQLRGDGGADPVPERVEAFLKAGEAPVFIGFGSLSPPHDAGRREARTLLESAVRLSGHRAIIQGIVPADEAPDDEQVLHVDRVPHASVYPRCRVVVHHGGAGTTQTALTAGVPSVIVPHVFDQFTWGRVIQRLGAGPKAAPRRTLRPEVLAARIREAAGTPSMRVRAAELGAALQAEDGCAEAVRLVEEVIAKHV